MGTVRNANSRSSDDPNTTISFLVLLGVITLSIIVCASALSATDRKPAKKIFHEYPKPSAQEPRMLASNVVDLGRYRAVARQALEKK
jgi:hypothetical protein